MRRGGLRCTHEFAYWQLKFAASSLSPLPLYFAPLGDGQSGRVRFAEQSAGTSAFTPPALPAPRAVATTESGAIPFSTQFTSGVSMSN